MDDSSQIPGVAEGNEETATEKAVHVELADILCDSNRGIAAFVLRETEGSRALAFFISGQQAVDSAFRLRGKHVRPTVHDCFATALTHLEGELTEVYLHGTQEFDHLPDSQNAAYLSLMRVRRGTQTWDIDARPSDATMAALISGAPIRAAETLLQDAKLEFPPAQAAKLGLGIEQLMRRYSGWSQGPDASSDRQSAEEAREAYEQDMAVYELLNYILYRSTEPPAVEKPIRVPWWAFWLRKQNPPTHKMGPYPIPCGGAAGTADLPTPSEAERAET